MYALFKLKRLKLHKKTPSKIRRLKKKKGDEFKALK